MARTAGGRNHDDETPPTGAASKAPTDRRRATIVEARLALLRARFGDRWTEEQGAQVRRAVERDVDLAERLRRTPLGNGDEPEIVFVPYRADESGEGGEAR